jgi:glycosyltransferase involved in cell wall biosynthesis
MGLARFRPSLEDSVVHCHRAEIGAAVSALYPRNSLFQFIHTEADVALRFNVETFWSHAPRLYFALERRAVRKAERTVVMSRSAVERLLRYSPSVVLGKNWFDREMFYCPDVSRSDSIPVIGWAGRLESGKDPLKAVRVFESLKQNGVGFQAWIAGSGSLEDAVATAIYDAGLAEDVQVLGLLSPAELGDRLRQTHVQLMTSLWEAIPRAAIEALACGVPVVATDVGEMRSLVSPGVNGFLSSSGDVQELADLVVDALAIRTGTRVADTVVDLEVVKVVSELFAAMA